MPSLQKYAFHLSFIPWDYKKNTENNPSSMAILDKKLRSIANDINDNFIKKYVLN